MAVVSQPTEPAFPDIRFAKIAQNPPVPAVQDDTTFFDAGPVTIGVEYRFLNEEILTAVYGTERAQGIISKLYGPEAVEQHAGDEGVSIHVFDSATRVEHLRFDDLDDNRHYHYLRTDGRHAVTYYDEIANGPYRQWVLRTLRTRIAPMLELADQAELAARIDQDVLDAALDQVEQLLERLRPAA